MIRMKRNLSTKNGTCCQEYTPARIDTNIVFIIRFPLTIYTNILNPVNIYFVTFSVAFAFMETLHDYFIFLAFLLGFRQEKLKHLHRLEKGIFHVRNVKKHSLGKIVSFGTQSCIQDILSGTAIFVKRDTIKRKTTKSTSELIKG